MLWAVLPLRTLAGAKQRLASVLDDQQRSELFRAMVSDVLSVLAAHSAIDRVVVVSGDSAAGQLAEDFGVEFWREPDGLEGLSQAVQWAAGRIAEQGGRDLLVVHGDLPLLQLSDIDSLLEAHQPGAGSALTLVADRRQQGSNCLLVSPPDLIDFRYGPDSLHRHIDSAEQNGVRATVLYLEGPAMDIDEVADLQLLQQTDALPRHTASVVEMLPASARADSSTPQFPEALVQRVARGEVLNEVDCLQFADDRFVSEQALQSLMAAAAKLRDSGFHNVVTYSRKVFIPLTHLCRDVCHYCTFARTPKRVEQAYLSVEEVVAMVRQAAAAGCQEALFTLGEKPELRYSAARDALRAMGFETTLEYLAHVAAEVLRETSVLPHINAGCMTPDEISMLREVSASMGIMLESSSERLCQKGMPHYGSPDKRPEARLATIASAGEARVPFTSGILIGIGETRRERIESLLQLRDLHQRYGHLQEIIIQNFRSKPGTKMAAAPEPDLNELLWTIAVARLIFGSGMSIQAPPNLSPGVLPQLIAAGINDWGGVSPVTPDFVNPEAPWPHLQVLAKETAAAGKWLQQRLTVYPRYALEGETWLHQNIRPEVLQLIDAGGFARDDSWRAGESTQLPAWLCKRTGNEDFSGVSRDIRATVDLLRGAAVATESAVARLFEARGVDFDFICAAADEQRRQVSGDQVSFVVNRNINYTNVCYFKCGFCAFSKGKLSENLRGRPYDISAGEIARRCTEAWHRGATEVCMQGGIHPRYDGNTYLDILSTVRAATPQMHIHAFSPLEVWQGAQSLGLSLRDFLLQLKDAGLNTLPGTAAEILDDEVRASICPDKINTQQWLQVMETAHSVGFKTTATMMFGHTENYRHWARHLELIRSLQHRTNGFTEFVPLPFVAMEAPMYLKGRARSGPTLRESILVHAVARLVLSPAIPNIQTSWVKLGRAGAEACLNAGANDLGGTLMNESITRAAGAEHGQEFSPEQMEALISGMGREPRQRMTDYGEVSLERQLAGRGAEVLAPIVNAAPKPKLKNDKKSSKALIANG